MSDLLLPRPVVQSLRWIARHPVRLLEWAQIICLAWILAQASHGLGGFLYHPENLPDVSVGIGVLAGLHAIYLVSRRGVVRLHRLAWLPLPILLVATCNVLWVSPAPWSAVAHVWTWWLAGAIYWIVLHLPRTPRDAAYLAGALAVVAAWAFAGGFFQFYLFPDAFAHPARVQEGVGGIVRATGFLHSGEAFAALLLLLWPFALMGCWMPRLPGPVRILLGFLALCICNGILISQSRGAQVAWLLSLLLLPALIGEKRRWRRTGWLLAGVAVLLTLSWFSSDPLRQQLDGLGAAWSDPAWRGTMTGTWRLFLARPLAGVGLGSFAYLWEGVRQAHTAAGVLYPDSGWLLLLAETGLAGLFALAAPLLLLLLRGWRHWQMQPFFRLTQDELFRASNLPQPAAEAAGKPVARGSRRRHRRGQHQHKKQGRMPLTKVLLGAMLLGLTLIGVAAWFDAALAVPVVLWTAVAMAAIVAWLIDEPDPRPAPARPGRSVVLALAPLLVAFAAMRWGAPQWGAQYHHAEGRHVLEKLLRTPRAIFNDPAHMTLARLDFERAIMLTANHGPAWLDGGRAILAMRAAELETGERLAARAWPWLERALVHAPLDWRTFSARATARSLLGGELDDVEEDLRGALRLAPREPTPRLELARFLWEIRQDRAAARMLLAEALTLDPGHPVALQMQARWEAF
jgi:hypothetical protein